MRQIIKTNQNFVTGEHYEQRMLKPEQPSRNRVTVQLCNAETGKVVEEAITENAMSPCYESYAYEYLANVIAYNDTKWLSTLPLYPTNILLTDSDMAELEDLYFAHGTPVGSANRTDTSGSASSQYKGTFNSAESYDKIEDNYYRHIHLVYDWPTSAGNGKIQSIYWQPTLIDNAQDDCNALKVLSLALPKDYPNAYAYKDIYNLAFDKRGNTYYHNSSDKKWYKVLNQLPYLMNIEDKKLSTEPEAIFTSCEVNGCYYEVSSSYANPNTANFSYKMTITKYDTKGNVLDRWDEDLITPIPNLVELRNNSKLGDYGASNADNKLSFSKYCDNDGWIGLNVYYYCNGSRPEQVFPARNSAGELEYNKSYTCVVYTMYNVLTKQWLRLPNPWDVWTWYKHYTDAYFTRKLTDKNLVSCDGYVYLINITSNDVESLQVAANLSTLPNTSSSSKRTDFLKMIHATLPFVITEYKYPISSNMIFHLLPLVAHTRLAAPITKTSLNTMKIQYDFFFKVPIPLLPPDKCWDLYKTE